MALSTRFKFTLEYDGSTSPYWQPGERHVEQQALEEAVFKTRAETVTAHAAAADAGARDRAGGACRRNEKALTPDKLQSR
jgi:hypothetical protein